jgi:hydroxypyruvate reductase
MTLHRAFLETLYEVAVASAHPRALVDDTIERMYRNGHRPARVAIIALGKAAPAMAEAAVPNLAQRGATLTGGIVVGTTDGAPPHRTIVRAAGDHPVPGAASNRAANLLAHAVGRAHDEADTALVLLSGGTTSLVASPVPPVPDDAMGVLFDALLRSGWDIAEMNAVRKRFLEWGAGRLALALSPLPVHQGILCDTIHDDPAIVACGPCTPDPFVESDVRRRLARLGIDDAVRRPLMDYLDRVAAGEVAETPKADDPAFARVAAPVIESRATAGAAIAIHARDVGRWPVSLESRPLQGEARERGRRTAQDLLDHRRLRVCVVYSGETTVTIPAGATGRGGRCQELALAAAEVLDASYDDAGSVAIMAAGTDGRDGPTDAAGAIVDRDTWRRARANGVAPETALAMHDSHAALAAAGALIPARDTGTNVMDIVVGLVDGR